MSRKYKLRMPVLDGGTAGDPCSKTEDKDPGALEILGKAGVRNSYK
jgi:hypothetical protein